MVETDIARLRQLVDDLLEISRLDAHAAETVIEPVDLGRVRRAARARPRMGRRRPGDRAEGRGSWPTPTSAGWSASSSTWSRTPCITERPRCHRGPPHARGAQAAGTGESGRPSCRSRWRITVPASPRTTCPTSSTASTRPTPAASSGGSGLGLAIARENARLLGGDLVAANLPEGGARFVLTLPSRRLRSRARRLAARNTIVTRSQQFREVRRATMAREPYPSVQGGGRNEH